MKKNGMNYREIDFDFGDRKLVGQERAREQVERILRSDRVSHSYLFSGPPGTGKKAFALAFAELVNGIDNLTDISGHARSRKSSWFTHPDIHLFLPVPTRYSMDEMRVRMELLKEDPYEIIDFSLRPSISNEEDSKNRRAFYPIDYYRDEIRPTAFLKPNEGEKTVIVLSDIEQMRKETANAFLKLLEEPSENLMFILTTQSTDSLLPTILSRCQHIPLNPLKTGEIREALIRRDRLPEEDADYLSRVSGGNYAMTRFFDVTTLRETREGIINFLRYAYTQDAVQITRTAQEWQSERNLEGQLAVLNIMEVFLRDLMVYRSTGNGELVTNADQLEVIRKFCDTLGDARLEEMIAQIDQYRPMVYRYVQPKLIYTSMALRFSRLMRGNDPVIAGGESWKHLPAYTE